MVKTKKYIVQELGIILAYIVFYVINEIMISGGKYEGNIYTVILNIIVLAIILWTLRKRFYNQPLASRITQGLAFLLTFAILDFLLVNILAYKSSLMIYNSYQYYLYYGILLVIPIISPYVVLVIKRYQERKLQKQLDKPSSNHIIR